MGAPTTQLFPTSGRIPESAQIGRRATIDRLHGRLLRGQPALLFGPRRIGKSSVAAAALARVKDAGGIGIDLDLSGGIGDSRAFLAALATQVCEQQIGGRIAASMRRRRLLRRVDEVRRVVAVADALGIDEAAGVEHVVDALRIERDAVELPRVLAAIHADALISERPAVIFLDEVQHIAEWPESRVVQSDLAWAMRHRGRVGFVFAGSERRPIERLFAAGKPLHEEGLRFELPAIADRDWERGLIERFRMGGVDVDAGMVRGILAISDGHPQDTMRVCEHAYEWGLQSPYRRIDANVLHQAHAEARRHPSWGTA